MADTDEMIEPNSRGFAELPTSAAQGDQRNSGSSQENAVTDGMGYDSSLNSRDHTMSFGEIRAINTIGFLKLTWPQ